MYKRVERERERKVFLADEPDTKWTTGIFFREKDDGYKISLRSNDYVNVSDICLMFSGGGHIRAAGGSINLPFEQAKQKVIEECKKYLK